MEKYSCFKCCNINDYGEKNLTDLCPQCQLPYGFPLSAHPEKIDSAQILEPLARGFYGCTYIGEIQVFGTQKIKKAIKIIPVELYTRSNKNFQEECENHLVLSEHSQHIVKIDPGFYKEKLPVLFSNGLTIDCHVVGLEYLKGVTLKSYLNQDTPVSIRTIAQIAIDLITLLQELRSNKKYHNDLHPGNIFIEELPVGRKRSNEIDENIRVVAIDLGSLNQKTKSHDDNDRTGDLHWVAQCLNLLSRKITNNLKIYNEKDWRLAFLLEEKSDYLKPEIIHQRPITYKDLINQIKDTYYQHTNPWKQPLILKSFDDAVNAQSLSPWHVSSLFVDKDNAWTKSISVKGPQVITGMRGCGKTMLLRALEFHARLMPQNSIEESDTSAILARLKDPSEGYVGLYISCVKLLDFNALQANNEYKEIFEPYSKLLVGYAIQAIHSIRHLQDLNQDAVRRDYFQHMGNSLASIIKNADELKDVISDYELENKLKQYLNSLSDGESTHIITLHPKIAFPQLTESLKKSSDFFSQSYIFYLLDDVSTRYLNDNNIIRLISELLFQDETCAFKFTTEAQTLEMVIMAPGSTSQAKIGRDYSIFDLGEQVNKVIHDNHHQGLRFIEDILLKRAKYFPSHPKHLTPSNILGNETLNAIAENIVKKERGSEKKELYHGITALSAVCVGDLGDVITLYELMLRNADTNNAFPINARIQNACFLELCNSRVYDLQRRNTRYLDFVESFADASHTLLVQSAIRRSKDGTSRLRQYTSIFINITYGDKDSQYKQVRQLIDAGIFNLQGGPEASRTNRQGLNPQQQFKLVFRKLYGVNKHIGLSSIDRFELSGKQLEDWLNNPKEGKSILTQNLNPLPVEDIEKYFPIDSVEDLTEMKEPARQMVLFNQNENAINEESENGYEFTYEKLPNIISIDENNPIIDIDVAILGLGFEDACLYSAKQIKKLSPKKVIFIKFEEEGQSKEILKEYEYLNNSERIIISQHEANEALEEIVSGNNIFCDVTALPKGIMFNTIRNIYEKSNLLYISVTSPQHEYPLNEEIKSFFDDNKDQDSSIILQKISTILNGEIGPYSLINLLPHYTNISTPRVLFAFASAKHERLYTLLDERDYEQINVVVSNGESPREKLARTSAEFSLRKFNSAKIHYMDQNDLTTNLKQLSKDYYNYFIKHNLPFEIGLTGNKIQTIAASIFSAIFKLSQCWYVKPKEWDTKRFSKGFNDFNIFKIEKQ